jgi:hypothetical protein
MTHLEKIAQHLSPRLRWAVPWPKQHHRRSEIRSARDVQPVCEVWAPESGASARYRTLPVQLRAHLPDARIASRGHRPERAAADVAGRIVELRVVEDIEELAPEFESYGFFDRDPDSKLIRTYDILNETTKPGTPTYGIPYPGVHVVDAQGRVVSKYFEDD